MYQIDKNIIDKRKELKEEIFELEKLIVVRKKFRQDRRFLLLNKKSKAENHFKKLLIDAGIKFTREKIQETIDRFYYTDFFIKDINLCIEVDGKEHENNISYDLKKEKKIFENSNSITIRFTNEEVLKMDKISIHDIYNRINLKFHKKSKFRNLYIRWKTINEKLKQKKEDEINNYDNFYFDEINRSLNQNEINVFIASSCPSLEEFSVMSFHYMIFDNKNLLEKKTITISDHQFVSSHKAEIIAINSVLEYLFKSEGLDLSVNIFSHNQFVTKKLSSNFYRYKNNDLSIYSDCMDVSNNLIDQFSQLTFSWIPKSQNPLCHPIIFQNLQISLI